ncbi:MAG: peptidylprolyl isomerase [Sodalis sp. (in: enterobacteria)]
MIENLHMVAKHVVFKIIILFIVISFFLSGVGNYLISGNGEYAAKVNGEKISYENLNQAMQNERNRQRKYTSEQFSQLDLDEVYMRQRVLSQLIDEILLDQYADTLGLVISDDQIKEAIFSIPDFHIENKFDNAKFRSLIGKIGISPDQYAALICKKLLNKQVIQGIFGSSFLLPSETEQLLGMAFQTRKARLATFDITAMTAKQTLREDEIQASYRANKTRYLLPETFKVSYISIEAETIKEKISINEQDIQRWYERHYDQFTVPARQRYSIIQSKTENDAKEWLKQLQHGADFATLAKTHSTDIVSAKNGGDIGWINNIDTLEELKHAKLSEKGHILPNVIKSPSGFLIVRLDDVKPEHIRPLSAVHDEVIILLKKEKTIDAYYLLQKKVSDIASNDNETLAGVEIASGLKAQETDWFSRDDVPAALNYDAVKKVLFDGSLLGNKNAPGSNSDLISVDGNRTMLLRIVDHRPEYLKPIENVRQRVEQDLKRQKALDQAYLDAEKILFALKHDNSAADKELQTAGLSFSVAQTFDSTYQNDPLTKAIFTQNLPHTGKSSYSIASNLKGDIVLIALDNVMAQPLDNKKRELFLDQFNYRMTGVIFNALLGNLRASAKIKISSTE